MSSEEFTGNRTSISVTKETNARLRAYMHKVHANSMEEVMQHFLGEHVLRIPMNPTVYERWAAVADDAGYDLNQWVAQRVESAITFGSDPQTVVRALKVVLGEERHR